MSARKPPKRPYKPRDPSLTSAMMARVKGTDNKCEVALRRALWRRGLRYRLYGRGLSGRPDLVFASARVAVFVDGDFWHGRSILDDGVEEFRTTMRTERREWWISKLRRNIERDTEVTADLRRKGWKVIRVWESSLKADTEPVAERLARQIIRRRLDLSTK